jgi:hypothetical protein
MNNSSPDRQKYFEKRSEYNDRSGSKIHVKNRHIEEFRKLQLDHERRQEEIIRGNYREKGILLNTVGIEQKKERDLLRIQHVGELAELKMELFPDFDRWQQQKREVQDLSDENEGLENSEGK